MDKEIEDVVKQCDTCQSSRFLPPVAPLHRWKWPQEPWSWLHIDFAGLFMGRMFLVLIDAHSKWVVADSTDKAIRNTLQTKWSRNTSCRISPNAQYSDSCLKAATKSAMDFPYTGIKFETLHYN